MLLAPQQIRTFFVTTVTANRRRIFQVERNANLLMNVLNDNRAMGRFAVHSFVIMPDHIHLIMTPSFEMSLEKAMQFIQGGFSFRLKGDFAVWQKDFNEHRVKDAHDYLEHQVCIEQNRVCEHLVSTAGEFPYSSAYHTDKGDAAPEHLRPDLQG